MKNKIFIIWFIFISLIISPVTTHGDSSTCSIQTEASESLTNYIKNIRTAVTNINKVLLTKNSEKDTGKYSITLNTLSRIYNETINWDWFYTDFSYYVTSPLLKEIPNQVQRDLTLLENETEWLRNYLETLVNKWYSWVSLTQDEVCTWVKNCILQWDPIDIIWDIIKNNTQITTLYKQVITQENQKFTIDTILTYDSNSEFIWELEKHYWNNTCSNTTNGFSERIDTAIDAILLKNQQWINWINEWKNAWKLLIWNDPGNWETYEEREKKILEQELSRQGLSANTQWIILKNLETFNKNWFYSLENNFIENSFQQLKNAWWNIVNWFIEATQWLLTWEDTKNINNQAAIWINELTTNINKINTSDSIKKRLANLYENHTKYALIESYSTEKIQADIIKMHSNITNSSEVLKATCELAVKVCNDQWNGKWNCWTCK